MPEASPLLTRLFGVGLAAALAAVTVTLAVTGRIGLYINPESAWFAVGMSILGLVGAVVSFALPLGAEADHGHDHGHAPGVALADGFAGGFGAPASPAGGLGDGFGAPASPAAGLGDGFGAPASPAGGFEAPASPAAGFGDGFGAPATRRGARFTPHGDAAAPNPMPTPEHAHEHAHQHATQPTRAHQHGREARAHGAGARRLRIAFGAVAASAGGVLATGVVGLVLVTPPATLSAELAMSRDTGTPPLFQGADTVALATTGDTASFGVGEWASVFATATNPEAFEGDEISLTGFVTPSSAGEFGLTRLVITHCVIDAQPASVPVGEVSDVPATGEWVTVTGVIRDRDGSLVVEATGVQTVAEPQDPYEY